MATIGEAYGFDWVSVADSPTVYQESFLHQLEVARTAPSVTVGPMTSHVVVRHPLIVGNLLATLNEFCDGRVIGTIATGNSAARGLGLKPAKLADIGRGASRRSSPTGAARAVTSSSPDPGHRDRAARLPDPRRRRRPEGRRARRPRRRRHPLRRHARPRGPASPPEGRQHHRRPPGVDRADRLLRDDPRGGPRGPRRHGRRHGQPRPARRPHRARRAGRHPAGRARDAQARTTTPSTPTTRARATPGSSASGC